MLRRTRLRFQECLPERRMGEGWRWLAWVSDGGLCSGSPRRSGSITYEVVRSLCVRSDVDYDLCPLALKKTRIVFVNARNGPKQASNPHFGPKSRVFIAKVARFVPKASHSLQWMLQGPVVPPIAEAPCLDSQEPQRHPLWIVYEQRCGQRLYETLRRRVGRWAYSEVADGERLEIEGH